jgi:hypothetical protein
MIQFILLHSRQMDPQLSQGLVTRPFEFGIGAQVFRCCHHFKATMIQFILLHSHQIHAQLSWGLMTRPFEFRM